jgi:hypothetical protein
MVRVRRELGAGPDLTHRTRGRDAPALVTTSSPRWRPGALRPATGHSPPPAAPEEDATQANGETKAKDVSAPHGPAAEVPVPAARNRGGHPRRCAWPISCEPSTPHSQASGRCPCRHVAAGPRVSTVPGHRPFLWGLELRSFSVPLMRSCRTGGDFARDRLPGEQRPSDQPRRALFVPPSSYSGPPRTQPRAEDSRGGLRGLRPTSAPCTPRRST